MTIKTELKRNLNSDTKENKGIAKQFSDDIDSAFSEVLINPDDRAIAEYRKKEKTIIATFIASMGGMLSTQLSESAQLGVDAADKALKGVGKTEKVRKIKSSVYNDAVKYRYDSAMSNLKKVVSNVSTNTNASISKVKNSIQALTVEQQKKIAKEVASKFKNGMTSFKDAGGKTWTVERYTEMLTTTEIANATRQALFQRLLEHGQDLVRVKHLGMSPECNVCATWNGQILSLTGESNIYPSLAYAEECGLHHPNCDHVEYELPKEGDKDLYDKPLENPDIDGKIVEGVYSYEGMQRLNNINQELKAGGYNPSGHAIQRTYERTTPANVLDAIKNGDKWSKKGSNERIFAKGDFTVHLDKNEDRIITVIKRENGRIPKTWTKLENE